VGHCYEKGNVVNDKVVENRMILIVSNKIEKDLNKNDSVTRTWIRK
ncbi:36546_t:CDS:1, partial [Gigaspora margarita]